jgi:hypothetical protein
METDRSSRARVDRCDETVESWAPRLGIVSGRRIWRVRVDGGAADHEWHVVARAGERPLVLELAISRDRWARFTACVWDAPPWADGLGERLGADADLRRVRTVLLAGVTPATPLFEVRDVLEDDEEESWIAWRPCDRDAVADLVTASAGAALERVARRHGLELDATGLATIAAARARGAAEVNGVDVIGLDHARTVSAVSFAGAPALLIASVTVVDEQPFEDVLAAHAPALRLVPFAGPERAGEVLLQQEPGVALPGIAPGA